jgi:phage gpG-like protein
MRLELEVYGDVQLARELLRFRDRGMDMTPAFVKVADDFLEIGRQQFGSQGGRSGGWAPLQPAYLARKIRDGYDPRILHRTLRLRRSLTMSTADSIRRITPEEMFVGSRVPYGVHHQHGAPRANLPRRRPIELSNADRVRWIKILQRYLIEGRP